MVKMYHRHTDSIALRTLLNIMEMLFKQWSIIDEKDLVFSTANIIVKFHLGTV